MPVRAMTPRERQKLMYALNTYLGVYESWTHFKETKELGQFDEAVDAADWWFDWELVVRECAPEVLIVLAGDRRASLRFPVYAVVPGAGDWFELSSNPVLLTELLQSVESVDGDVGDVVQSLEHLRKVITSLSAERVGEGMKHLNALRRIIRPAM